MDKKKFDTWMTSINNDFLEEASSPPAKKRNYRTLAMVTAACLVLAATGLLLRQGLLPDTQPEVDGVTTEYITVDNIEYTILSRTAAEPTDTVC